MQIGNSAQSGCHAIKVQGDGKIVIGGYVQMDKGTDFAVVRMNADGAVDANFGLNGLVLVDVEGGDEEIVALDIASDGKIFATGNSILNGVKNFALVSIMPDGQLNEGFGVKGKVVTNIGGNKGSSEVHDVKVLSNGKVIAVGDAYDGLNDNMALVRYMSDGNLDLGFNDSGIVIAPTGIGNSEIQSMLVQPDGKILAGGSAVSDDGSINSTIRRFNKNGSVDVNFADSGVLMLDLDDLDGIFSMSVQPDGRVIGVAYGGDFGNKTLKDTMIHVIRLWP